MGVVLESMAVLGYCMAVGGCLGLCGGVVTCLVNGGPIVSQLMWFGMGGTFGGMLFGGGVLSAVPVVALFLKLFLKLF